MSYYLVWAKPRTELLAELRQLLDQGRFVHLRPFGSALTNSLERAMWDAAKGLAVWEEEDYCTPPLAQERAAVLDRYFEELHVELVARSEGWRRIDHLPLLWRML
jgi:hypothetical protein